MRIAVALPSLEASAPHRRAIDGMLARVVDAGHEVEGFAEHDRADSGCVFPVFHYLRLPARHAARPFDSALYPIGRDASPYQGVYFSMNRLPGVVWFLDPIVHHFAVGGIALMDRWAAYRGLLDDTYGNAGAAVAQTVASNWGTGGLFRRYDMLAALASSQRRVLAAWPALAGRISQRLDDRPVGVLPLAMPAGSVDVTGTAAPGGVAVPRPRAFSGPGDGTVRGLRDIERVTIMTVNESCVATAMRAAAAAVGMGADLHVRVCLSAPIYRAEGSRMAARLGIEERLEWVLTGSPEHLAEAAVDSDVLVWLAEELEGRHRLLLLQGMADGRPTFVPGYPLYDDLPDGCVVRLDPGRALAPSLAALLGAVRKDGDLRGGLVRCARAFARSAAGAAETAQILVAELKEDSRSGPLAVEPVSRSTWDTVDRQMIDAAVPGGASAAVRQRIAGILRSHTELLRQ